MHDVIVVVVELMAILGATLWNHRGLVRIENRLGARLGGMQHGISSMQSELAALRSEFHREFEQFYRTLGQHDARIDNIEKQQ